MTLCLCYMDLRLVRILSGLILQWRTDGVCVSVRPSRPTLDQIKARNNRRTALGHARDILQNECALFCSSLA